MRIEESGFDKSKLQKSKSQKYGDRQGDETKRQLKRQLQKNRIENVAEEKEKNPNKDRQQSVEISDVLQRLISRDRKNSENPRLTNYLKWVFGKIEKIGEETDIDIFSECRMDFERSSGPGGQNVNKTSSAVDLRHKYLGVRLFVQEKRDQVGNRQIAGERMKELVMEHMRIWEEVLEKSKGEWKEVVREEIERKYEELVAKKKVGKEKQVEILGVIGGVK